MESSPVKHCFFLLHLSLEAKKNSDKTNLHLPDFMTALRGKAGPALVRSTRILIQIFFFFTSNDVK